VREFKPGVSAALPVTTNNTVPIYRDMGDFTEAALMMFTGQLSLLLLSVDEQ